MLRLPIRPATRRHRSIRLPRVLVATMLSVALMGCSGGFDLFSRFNDNTDQAPEARFTLEGLPTFGQPAQSPAAPTTAVSILLPLSGQHAALGQNMAQAAQLAMEDVGQTSVQFTILDTGSTPQGAMGAAQMAMNTHRADLILGPLLGPSFDDVSQYANGGGVSVLGYTNDVTRARAGAWTFGLAPEQSINRTLQWGSLTGYRQIAVLAPTGPYGDAAIAATKQAAARFGMLVTVQDRYSADDISKNQAAERIAQNKDFFDVIMIPDRGNALREIASLLYFHGVDPTAKKYLGLEGWNDTALAREQSLVGGVYAVPPVGPITQFESRYASRFGATPNLQSMAVYDSILMAAELATPTAINSQAPAATARTNNPYAFGQLTRPQGFNGLLGTFRLTANGRVERLYEVKQITPGGLMRLAPAPNSFDGVGF